MNKLYIIGITGSYGKTSCAYALHAYFQSLNYKSCLISSNQLDFPDLKNTIWNNEITTQESLNYYLAHAQGCDFLIIETHEESIKNHIYDNLVFDCKILTNFKEGFNLHRSAEEYLQLKKDFFNQGDCLRIINKNIDCFNEFSQQNAIVFSTKENDVCDVYIQSQDLHFKNSSCQMMIGKELVEIQSSLNGVGYKNLVSLSAVLYGIDMFDKDLFLYSIASNILTVKGRHELHDYKNRNVIIDSGNVKALIDFVQETPDVSNYNIKGLISVAGGINDNLYNDLALKGFVSLNKYKVADPLVRKHCLTFGGNLYNACYKLSVLPDLFVFNEVIEEIGADRFLDFSNIDISLPEELVNNMVQTTLMLGNDDISKNLSFCQRMWWRSIPNLKGYFTIHYDEFLQIYEQFIALNNATLTESCNFVKEMIDYTILCYRQLGDSLQSIDVNNIYLTMSSSNEYGNQLELEMYKAFFKQNVKVYASRQDALNSIVQDSNENDILYIAGRGDRKTYRQENGATISFSDEEYLQQLFEEVN